jgi:hypothetical protein
MIRSRFSLRTLAIAVTLVCAYFGAWEATTKCGVKQFTSRHYVGGIREQDGSPKLRSHFDNDEQEAEYLLEVRRTGIVSCPMPFVLSISPWRQSFYPERRCFYIWLFGPTIKLPYEPEW